MGNLCMQSKRDGFSWGFFPKVVYQHESSNSRLRHARELSPAIEKYLEIDTALWADQCRMVVTISFSCSVPVQAD